MKILQLMIFIALSAQTLLSQAQPPSSEEICMDAMKAEKELEKAVVKIQLRYNGDPVFLSKFDESQKLWMKYRKALLEMKFPAADKEMEYGSMYQTCNCLEKIRLTRRKIQELEPWVSGKVEGDVCPGSVLIEKR